MIAGGGSYYFAKQQINADKKARHEAEMKRRRLNASLEETSGPQPSHRKEHHKGRDHAGSPSGEASADPAPTSHDGASVKKSKYEPTEVYRTKKGDRFSAIANDADGKE